MAITLIALSIPTFDSTHHSYRIWIMLYSILRVASLVVLLSSSCGVFWSKKKKSAGCQDGQCNQNVVVSEYSAPLSFPNILYQLQVFNNGDWIDGKSVVLTPSECSTNKDLGLYCGLDFPICLKKTFR